MKSLLREPLIHFALFGAVLFAVDALTDAEPEVRRIVVTDELREELSRQWALEHEGPPSGEELDRLVEEWVDEEVLYREGLARGLDRDDPSVRARVANKMAIVVRSEIIVPEPSDAELRASFERTPERWADAARVDFTHVFVADGSEERAAQILGLVRSGATPSGLGDRFSGGRRYRQRRIEDLARQFGEEFARGVDAQEIGTWQLRRSRFGLHVLRVDARTEARAPTFESVRGDVRSAWIEARRAREVRRSMRELRAGWEIDR